MMKNNEEKKLLTATTGNEIKASEDRNLYGFCKCHICVQQAEKCGTIYVQIDI
jgi:hypothetical protein